MISHTKWCFAVTAYVPKSARVLLSRAAQWILTLGFALVGMAATLYKAGLESDTEDSAHSFWPELVSMTPPNCKGAEKM